MNKYIINPDSPHQRVIQAHKFELIGDYFWFLDSGNNVVSINKAEHIDRVDLEN